MKTGTNRTAGTGLRGSGEESRLAYRPAWRRCLPAWRVRLDLDPGPIQESITKHEWRSWLCKFCNYCAGSTMDSPSSSSSSPEAKKIAGKRVKCKVKSTNVGLELLQRKDLKKNKDWHG